VQRCICSNCESHLGFIYDDGPAPFGKRFMINSASLVFSPKPWFKIPEFTKEQWADMKAKREESIRGRKAFLRLIHDEKMMNFPSYEQRVKREKYIETRAKNIAKEKKARKIQAAEN
jgi:hypothetical protein